MSVIIVGSNHTNTANYYKKLGLRSSVLVTDINHKELIGHTCIQDIPDYSQLEVVLKNADEVYWAESNKDEFYDDNSYYDFLNWLKDYNLKNRNVKNFKIIKFDNYSWTTNLTTNPDQAVFLGCSFTAGSGLSNSKTHYAAIVSNHFGKQLLNLGVPGGSNNLIFDQFTQLNFHPGQIVVLQFTLLERIRYCNTSKQLISMRFANMPDKQLTRSMLEVYHKDFLFYELLVKMRAIITIARLQKLKLIFWLIDYKHEDKYSKLDQTYFYDLPEFVPYSWMANYLVDTAEDNIHPGIESNKNIANTLINYIETIYECRH
jgi:hypothetical protein